MVTTDDGYILKMLRIKKPSTGRGAPVAFCQHGLMSQADTFINNEPSVALGFRLANEGYDVFFGNNRGNSYSPGHMFYSQQSNPEKYFDYSFPDLGNHDLPAQLTKALSVSGAQKLTYIGHSQGTSQMFYKLSKDEDLIASKVNLFVALAPVVRFADSALSLKWASYLEKTAEEAMDGYGAFSVFGKAFDNEVNDWKKNTISGSIFEAMANCVMGASAYNSDKWSQVSKSWSPAKASTKEIFHYGEMIRSGQF